MKPPMPERCVLIDESRWQSAVHLASGWIADDKAPAITFVSGSTQRTSPVVSLGSQITQQFQPLPEMPIYLVASITKPIVATAAALLMERGRLALSDRVTDYLPEFGTNGKYGVEVRHLLTHTSGLPDMLPNNLELRAANAPLSEFLKGVCASPLGFPPGRGVQYQSTGFLVLGEIIARITGKPCGRFLHEELFTPLGMTDTALGPDEAWLAAHESRIVEVRLEGEQVGGEHWNWNSRYWRQLGAPWGGLLTTADDLAKFARCLLRGGRTDTGRLLIAPATLAAATRNQLASMREVPEDERRCRPWGLGWRLNWPAHSANFGDLLGPATYGHWGATGTVMWIDPDRGVYAVILTSQPQEPGGQFLARLSNVLAAAWG
jgi:CubicO group peptidase (beta-lactamase class C family)